MYRYLSCRVAASLVIFVLLASPVKETEGCDPCLRTHPQRQYCDASFVIRGRVISRESPSPGSPTSRGGPELGYAFPQVTYTIYVNKVYKGEGIVTPRQRVQITIEANSAVCGAVDLRENKRYVIMGTGTAGSLTTDYCQYHEEWVYWVSKVHRQGLFYHWNKYCGDCEAVSCHYWFYGCNGETSGRDVCVIPNAYSAGCEIDFARCRRDWRGRCVWYGEHPYNNCVEARAERGSYGGSYFQYY